MSVIKSVITIQNIMSIRLFCGFYYNISTNKLVNVLVRAYCVFVATMLVVYTSILTLYFPFSAKVRFGLLSTLYATNVFISLLFSGENLFLFLEKNQKITPALELNDEISFSRFLFIFLLLGKVATHFLYSVTTFNLSNVFTAATIAFIFDMSQHTSNFTRIIMFELLWHRMAMLRKQLEKDVSVARRFQEGEEVMKKKLRSCINTYKNLLKTTQDTDAPMKFMIFSSIVLLILKMLITIYLTIAYKSKYYMISIIVYEALMECIVTFSPALLAEMVCSQIDGMKLCVVKQLLVCRGDTTRDAIDDAMLYFRQHPFKYSIWRLFTLDLGMILSVIALLTTYTVAMVQFAHFFD